MVAIEGENCGLKGMVTICAPYELYVGSRVLETTLFGLYDFAMGASLARKLKENQIAMKPLEKQFGINLESEIKKVKGIRDFDRLFTAKTHGYGTTDMYYRSAALGQRLKDIKIPTLLISPLDDPIVPYC